MPKAYTPQEVLALKIHDNDANAETFGGYLGALVHEILDQQESFSGKRPFGNSDWLSPLIHTLILNDFIDGDLDDDGIVDDYNSIQFYRVLADVTELLQTADYTTLSLPPEPKEYFLIAFDSDGEMSGYIEFPHTQKDAKKQLEALEESYPAGYWRIVHIPK